MKKSKITPIQIIIAILSILCLSIAIFMTIDSSSKNAVCTYLSSDTSSEKPLFSCDGVKQSKYAQIAGIPLSAYGIAAFSIMTLAIIGMMFARDKFQIISQAISVIGIVCAAISAITLLSIQAFILKQYCPLCLIVDSASIILLILIIPQILPTIRAIKEIISSSR